MNKPKIYLETTMFNYYFDADRDAHLDTVKLFSEVKDGKYIAYTSAYVLLELEREKTLKREKMLGLIGKYNINVLDLDPEAERIADIYIQNGILPSSCINDCLHIASATVNNLDMIISLNFAHIVRRKTILLTEIVNIKEGYKGIGIYSPMEVVENEELF